MTYWAIARPARFINPPETLPLGCRLDGEAYDLVAAVLRVGLVCIEICGCKPKDDSKSLWTSLYR